VSPDLRDLFEAVLDGRAADLGPEDRARALRAGAAVVLALASAPAPESTSAVALAPGNTLMTLAEVARLLNVHRKTVQRYVRTAGLPACRLPGGDLRFHRHDLLQWMAQRKEQTP